MLYSLLRDAVEKYPDKIALQIKRDGQYQRYSYQELKQYASNLASYLQNLGIQPEDRVALWGESIPEWTIAYLGIYLSGAIAVPLDPQLSSTALANLLSFCNTDVLICSETLLDKAHEVPQKIHVLSLQPQQHPNIFSPAENKDFQPHQRDGDAPMSIIFTSGTTGDPKGVVLSYNNFIADIRGALDVFSGSHRDVFLCVLPLYHCAAFSCMLLGPLYVAGTVTFQPTLQGAAIMSAMQETKVTFMLGVPQLFAIMDRAIFAKVAAQSFPKRMIFKLLFRISHYARKWFRWNLGKIFFRQIHQRFGENFRFFMSGGAKLDAQVAEHFWDLGVIVMEGYGLTETSPVIAMTTPHEFWRGSVGKPITGVEVKIVNTNENGVGEIAMRGPTLMQGYYNNPKATAEVIRNGWFHTGDLGYLDRQGRLYITGRAKEVIVLPSGKNIYPEEVEREYEKSPVVSEICVMGEKQSERLTALVYPDFDTIARMRVPSIQVEVKFQIEQISLRLPSYMRVSSVKIVSQPFPRTSLGKLKRKAIAEEQHAEYKDSIPREISQEDQKYLAKPDAKDLLKYLQELVQYQDTIFPGDSLELDLGLDSIKYMELLSVLQQRFEISFPESNPPVFTHVRDILKILPDTKVVKSSQNLSGFDWNDLLQQPCSVSIDEVFSLRRSVGNKLLLAATRLCGRSISRILVGGKGIGFEKLVAHQGPMIIAPTHQSYLDPPLLYNSLPSQVLGRTIFTAMEAIFGKWPFNKLTGFFWIIRTASSSTTLTSMQQISEALRRGFSVCVFPEGLRSSDGSVRKPMLGTGILACHCQATVFPVRIDGAMRVLSRENPGFHFANITFTVLDPIVPPQKSQYNEQDYQEVVDAWYNAVTQK